MKAIKNILFWISTVCLVLAIIAVGVPKLFGVEFRAVVSGSMTPEIPVGSLVVVVPTKAEDIQIGDDITFVSAGEVVVTHRVVDINRETNEFTTWGIANDRAATDAPNKYENIIGVVRLHIPYVGQIFSWFSTTYGKIITATAIIAAFLLSTILGIWSKDKNDRIKVSKGSTQKDVPVKKNQRKVDPPDSSGESEVLFDNLSDSSGESEALFDNLLDSFKESEVLLDDLIDSLKESEVLFSETRSAEVSPSSDLQRLQRMFEEDDFRKQ